MQKLKFYVIWLPFLICIVSLEMLTIVEAYMVTKYWGDWIHTLKEKEDSY